MAQQSKIDIETQAGALLRKLATTGFSGYYPEEVYCWLESREYIYFVGLNPKITTKGEAYYAELCAGSVLRSNPRSFKEEALTGIREVQSKKGGWKVSEQSKIKRAAVPTCGAPRETRTPEDMIAENQGLLAKRDQLLTKWGITLDEYHIYEKEGRVRLCKTCDEIGLFDRKGKYFRDSCRGCMKAKRR